MSEKLLEQILEELKEIKTEQQSTKAEIQGLKTEQQGTKAEIQGLKTEQQGTKAEQQKTNQRLDKIEELVSDIPAIKLAVLETHNDMKQVIEDQKSIHEILGEHEVSIRTFRRRPV